MLKHLEHMEDMLFTGDPGDYTDMLEHENTFAYATCKYDGAPALVWGMHWNRHKTEHEFFVSTKSYWNKERKFWTNRYEAAQKCNSELWDKIGPAVRHLFGIHHAHHCFNDGIYQGDLLLFNKQHDMTWGNKLLYSCLHENDHQSVLVWHSTFEPEEAKRLEGSQSDSPWYPWDFDSKRVKIMTPDTKGFTWPNIPLCEGSLFALHVLADMPKATRDRIKRKWNRIEYGDMILDAIDCTKIDKLKSSSEVWSGIHDLYQTYNLLKDEKHKIINRLDGPLDSSTVYVWHEDIGLIQTSHEGWVLKNGAFKLVDKSKFTLINNNDKYKRAFEL